MSLALLGERLSDVRQEGDVCTRRFRRERGGGSWRAGCHIGRDFERTVFRWLQPDLTRGGSLIYHRGATLDSNHSMARQLRHASIAGRRAGHDTIRAVSPDGERLRDFAALDGLNADIWVYAWRSARGTRVTEGPEPEGLSCLGVRTAATSCLRALAPWYGALPTRLKGPKSPMAAPKQGTLSPLSFTPDGRETLAFSERAADGKWSVKTAPIRSNGMELPRGESGVVRGPASGAATAAFSPDGRWLYTSAESG